MTLMKSIKKKSLIWYMDHIKNDVRQAIVVGIDTIDKQEVYVVTNAYAGVAMKQPLLPTKHVLGEWAFDTEQEAKECLKKHIELLIKRKNQEIKELKDKLLKL